MSLPQPNAKLRILVCDGRLSGSHDDVKIYGSYTSGTLSAVETVHNILEDRAEITRVNSLAEVIGELGSRKFPYYALVIYASYHINDKFGGNKLDRIKQIDPFLPQLVYGDEISKLNLAKSMRRGVRYYSTDAEELRVYTGNIFMAPGIPMKKLTVVKFGGSCFDFDRQNRNSYNLRHSVQIVEKLKKEKPKLNSDPSHKIIATVGVGQVGDVVKDTTRKYEDMIEDFPQLIAGALSLNLNMLMPIWHQVLPSFLVVRIFIS